MWTGEPILISSIEDREISVVHLKADGSVHSMRVLCAFQRFLSRLRLPLGMQVVYETRLGTVSTNSGDCTFDFAMGFRCYAVPGVLDETTARRYNIKLNKLRRGEIFTRNGATKCIPMYWPAED